MAFPERKIRVESVRLIENAMTRETASVVKCKTFDGGRVETWGMVQEGESLYWMWQDAFIRDMFESMILDHYNAHLDHRSWGYDAWQD